MADCALLNLGTCLPQKFFEYLLSILNAPINRFMALNLNLLSERISITVFSDFWVIIVYMLSMFYALLLLATGFSFMMSGHDVVKRENSKQWLRNIVIMIILIQSSFFIYQLAIDLSANMTSATLSLLDRNFFNISLDGITDVALQLPFSLLYITTLITSSLILTIRYAIVAIGVVLFPLAIFFYFFNPLKQYGVLVLNFLGISIFVTFLDSILLIGFSKLAEVDVFSGMKILILICSFMIINIFMLSLMFFSIVKAGFSVYSDVKKIGSLM